MLGFIDWVTGLWSNIFYILDEELIIPTNSQLGGVSFLTIIMAYAFLQIVIIRLINSRG